MLGKIAIIVVIIAAFMNYNNVYRLYFWLSIADGLIILIFGYIGSYIIARPQIEKYKQAVWEMKES